MSVRGQMWVARKFPRAVRVYLWLWFVLVTIALAAYLPYSIGDLTSISGAGSTGSVVVTHCTTNEGFYQHCFGDFTSGDGSVSIKNARVTGGDYATVGAKYAAHGDAATNSVNSVRSGGTIAADIVVPLVLLAMWVPLLGYCVVRPIGRRRRRGREVGATPA